MHRRRFLKASLLAAAAPVAPSPFRQLLAAARKKILVLGGSSFLDPAVVETAVVAGHTVRAHR